MMVLGMVVVFQIPTVVLFLAKMGMVSAGFMWRNFKYAILVSFIVAAILTPSPDPWNQTVFALPMIGLYLLSIGLAWIVGQKRDGASERESSGLRLVIGAVVADQARRHARRHAA